MPLGTLRRSKRAFYILAESCPSVLRRRMERAPRSQVVNPRESEARSLLSRLLILPFRERVEPAFRNREAQDEYEQLRADVLAFLSKPVDLPVFHRQTLGEFVFFEIELPVAVRRVVQCEQCAMLAYAGEAPCPRHR
jgi:hypothetical protein